MRQKLYVVMIDGHIPFVVCNSREIAKREIGKEAIENMEEGGTEGFSIVEVPFEKV